MGIGSFFKKVGSFVKKNWLSLALTAIPFVGPITGLLAKAPMLAKAFAAVKSTKAFTLAKTFVPKFLSNPLAMMSLRGLTGATGLTGLAANTLDLSRMADLMPQGGFNLRQIFAAQQGSLINTMNGQVP